MPRLRLIGLDWGTTSARAYAFGAGGEIIGDSQAPLGIQQLGELSYPQALQRLCRPWLAEFGATPVIAAGMIGSRQGWVEAPYIECPAALTGLAAGLVRVDAPPAVVWLVPGVMFDAPDGSPDVIRGEETQIAGLAFDTPCVAILPGTHSKWVAAQAGEIRSFVTFMTGEVFAVLREHSILGRLADPDGVEPAAFDEGVATALRTGPHGGALLHDLFTARTRALVGRLPPRGVSDYLSGVLIGSEVAAGLGSFAAGGDDLVLVGDGVLCDRYRRALRLAGRDAVIADPGTTARGLWRIAVAANLVDIS